MSFRFCETFLSCGHEQRSGLPRVTALQRACVHKSSLNMIKSLVEDDRGLLLMRDGSGYSVLHTAAKYASLDAVKYLVGEMIRIEMPLNCQTTLESYSYQTTMESCHYIRHAVQEGLT